jgi:hypothetical protein
MHHRLFGFSSLAVALLLATAATPALAQRGRGGAPAAPAPPTPRAADGQVIWGALPGHKGVWNAAGSTLWDLDKPDPDNPNAAFSSFNTGKMKLSQVPLQPWARALLNERMIDLNEPYTRCKPSGGARNLFTPYGTEFLDFPEQKRFVITNTGGPHTYRIIYYDGRPHPKDLEPSYLGHSIGHWEGDTLVFDTIGFNERFWIDRQGSPHTDQLHLVERLTRTDFNTIKYEVTIEDPGAYTAPWKGGFDMRFTPDQESFEFMCQDNMKTSEINGVTSRVVP